MVKYSTWNCGNRLFRHEISDSFFSNISKAMSKVKTLPRFIFDPAKNKHRCILRPMLILFLFLGSFQTAFPQTTVLADSKLNPIFEMKNGSSRIGNYDGFPDDPCPNDPYEPDGNYSEAKPISTNGIIQAHVNTPPLTKIG